MKKILLSLAFALMPAFVLVPVVGAQVNPLEGACDKVTTDEKPAICDTPDDDPLTGTEGVIMKAADLVALITGVAAVFIIIIAGLQYITSAGEPNKISGARQTIIFAVIGLVVVFMARTVVAFIIRRL